MFVPKSNPTTLIAWVAVVALFAAVIGGPAVAGHVPGAAPIAPGHNAVLVLPIMNPDRGKRLFVDKGCIACHAINGIGGHDAPNMDAHATMGFVNPFDFAAKMWNHAGAMISAQEEGSTGWPNFSPPHRSARDGSVGDYCSAVLTQMCWRIWSTDNPPGPALGSYGKLAGTEWLPKIVQYSTACRRLKCPYV